MEGTSPEAIRPESTSLDGGASLSTNSTTTTTDITTSGTLSMAGRLTD